MVLFIIKIFYNICYICGENKNKVTSYSMKKIFIPILSFLLFSLYISTAQARCNFQAKLGEKKITFEERKFASRGFPMEHVGLEVYPILAEDICSNQKLKDIGIEYKFLNDELIAINMVALNDENNSVSEKLTLMNYAKNNYGTFDTTQNPKSYSGYEIFEKTNQFIVYQRLTGEDGIIDEQIYITTQELDTKLMEFYKKMELQQTE